MLIFTHIGNLKYHSTPNKINIARKSVIGFEQFIELAPSKELFYFYLNNRESGDWFPAYEKRFKVEMVQMKLILDELCEMSKVEDIVLFCFCRDYKKCHRYIEYLYCKDKCECIIE